MKFILNEIIKEKWSFILASLTLLLTYTLVVIVICIQVESSYSVGSLTKMKGKHPYTCMISMNSGSDGKESEIKMIYQELKRRGILNHMLFLDRGVYGPNLEECVIMPNSSFNIFNIQLHDVQGGCSLGSDEIQVYLGDSIKNNYKIGDTLTISQVQGLCKTSGILKPGQIILDGGGTLELDNKLVIRVPDSYMDLYGNPECLLQNGCYLLSTSQDQFYREKSEIQEVFNQYSVKLKLLSINQIIIDTLEETKDTREAANMYLWICTLLSCLSVTMVTIKNMFENKKEYAVLCINGFDKKYIGKIILGKQMILMLSPIVPAVLLAYSLFLNSLITTYSVRQYVIENLILKFIPYILLLIGSQAMISFYYIKKLNPLAVLKGEVHN